MSEHPVRVGWKPADGADALLTREWLVANGLGGYATGTVAGVCTRRYHGYLVASLPALGRTVMLSHLSDRVRVGGERTASLGAEESAFGLALHGAEHLREFRLELGLPCWTYEIGDAVVERRVVLPYGQKRALELALALALDPRLLLLDEPTAGMGTEDVERTVRLVREVREGRTVVLVEHNMSVVADLADRVTVLQAGAVLVEGPYEEVRRDPRVVEAYLGASADADR